MEKKGRYRLFLVITVVKALSARVMFTIHMLFSIWAATCVTDSLAIWVLMSVFGLFFVETIYSIVKRRGQEPRMFSPCIFLYLLAVVPPIWVLNLDMLHCFTYLCQHGNNTCVGLFDNPHKCSVIALGTYFNRKPLGYTLVQVNLFLLILGRWLLPKGNVSRKQLSELLFIYFGLTSDILDLFYLFDEPEIVYDEKMTYVILTVWSLSLFQFTVVMTAVKPRRARLSLDHTPFRFLTACQCCRFEIWSLLTTVILQDGPFILVRIYCLAGLGLFSYTLVFYTCKNTLAITLQTYRFIVLLLNIRENYDPNSEPPTSSSMATITHVMRNGGVGAPPEKTMTLATDQRLELTRISIVNSLSVSRESKSSKEISFESSV